MTNLHTHTIWSDGNNTIEETVRAAVDKGFTSLGFSDHAYTPLFEEGSIPVSRFADYLETIRSEKHPEIQIYAGLEYEYYCPQPRTGLDYVIGSVHYVPCGGEYMCVDNKPDELETLARGLGGYDNLARRYYEMIADMAINQKPDIIGHLDIITKFGLFDTRTGAYMLAVCAALDAIAQTECIIEVNTGGMARGYTSEPYPEWHVLREVRKRGIPVCLASDSHRNEDLDYAFADTARALKSMGFTHTRNLVNGKFTDIGL